MKNTSTEAEKPLMLFVLQFWRPHIRMIIVSLVFIATSSALRTLIPLSGKAIVSYTGEDVDVSKGAPEDSLLSGAHSELGVLSERVFGPILDVMLPWYSMQPYMYGLLCRCMLAAAAIVSFHATSLLGHLAAYKAGMRTQCSVMMRSLETILSTRHPERIAVVSAVKLSQMIASSAKASCDTLGAVLTDVVSCVLASLGALCVLLYISTPLTLGIGGMVACVQYIYYVAGRHQEERGAHVASAEANAHASLVNAISRSETVFVFDCKSFVLSCLQEKLQSFQSVSDGLNLSIHGYAAISSASTTLIFVVVLGACSYLHRSGSLEVSDIAIYFMFLSSFVSTLMQLAGDISKSRATLGRLRTLQRTLAWYEQNDVVTPEESESTRQLPLENEEQMVPSAPPVSNSGVVVHSGAAQDIYLEGVSFTYPSVPAFLTQEGLVATTPVGEEPTTCVNGVRNVSLRAAAGSITALYGPSGSGKSTCLRLFSGLVVPHTGTVCTHRGSLLMEQQHAIFIGTVAENILLQEIRQAKGEYHAPTDDSTATIRECVSVAVEESGCSAFLADPFTARIDNVDKPPFSGGQLQRICLARVFGRSKSDCTLVLLDEPTTGLDDVSVQRLLVTIQALRDVHGKTVLISTHDSRVAGIADSVIHLSHGSVTA